MLKNAKARLLLEKVFITPSSFRYVFVCSLATQTYSFLALKKINGWGPLVSLFPHLEVPHWQGGFHVSGISQGRSRKLCSLSVAMLP